jgi:hypothetical protein
VKLTLVSYQQIKNLCFEMSYLKLGMLLENKMFRKLEYSTKEYIERKHGEPFKFIFLPKMGLLGSQAKNSLK